MVLSGPEGMGKRALVQRLIKEDPLERCVRPAHWIGCVWGCLIEDASRPVGLDLCGCLVLADQVERCVRPAQWMAWICAWMFCWC